MGCSPHLWVGVTKHGHLEGPRENSPPCHPPVRLRPAAPRVGVGDSGNRGHRWPWSQPERRQAGLCEVDFHSNHRESVGPGLALGGKTTKCRGWGGTPGVLQWQGLHSCDHMADTGLQHGLSVCGGGGQWFNSQTLRKPEPATGRTDQDRDERFNSHSVRVASALTFPNPLPRERGSGF